MRPTPPPRRTASFSSVTVSGRPASTHISEQAPRSNSSPSHEHSRPSCSGESVVGVPPPTYTARTLSPSPATVSAVASISRRSAARKGSMSPRLFATDWLTKLQ